MRPSFWSVAAGLTATFALTDAASAAGPDLAIDRNRTTLKFISCDVDKPYLEGIVAYTNQGDQPALRGVGGRYFSIVRVSVAGLPEHAIANPNPPLKAGASSLPLTFTLGEGVSKSTVVKEADGKVRVVVLVDPLNRVAETNEKNNVEVFMIDAGC